RCPSGATIAFPWRTISPAYGQGGKGMAGSTFWDNQLPRRNPDGLIFVVEGPAFETDGYDLRVVERLLVDYRRLVDQTLPLAVGQRKLTDRLREGITYQVKFEPGSWRTILQLLLENQDLIASIAATQGAPQVLAEYVAKVINAVLDLRRVLDDLLQKGE